MNRAIVLTGCLAAAGAVGAYTHYSERPADQPPVFTVHAPQRPADPAPPAPQQRALVPPRDRASLTRALQRELQRVGCYSGDINGVWTTSSRMAMQSFTDRVNASLPIDNPDHILLSLVQGHKDIVCGVPCRSDQPGAENSACIASAADSRSPDEARPPDSKMTTSAVLATAAAAAALAASAAIPKGAPKEAMPDERVRPAAASPDDATPKSKRPETSQSGPVPSERVTKHKHRSPRYSNRVRPPRIVRDIMRAFGIR